MRRAIALGGMALILLLPACAGIQRPEGLVERWLTSLNQGRAGQPDRYAADRISQQVLPDWRSFDPGELDLIEVGRGGEGEGGVYQVPFRIETIEGARLRGIAEVDQGMIVGILASGQGGVGALPSEGGPRIGSATTSMWLAAIGAAALLMLISLGLMSLARRRTVIA